MLLHAALVLQLALGQEGGSESKDRAGRRTVWLPGIPGGPDPEDRTSGDDLSEQAPTFDGVSDSGESDLSDEETLHLSDSGVTGPPGSRAAGGEFAVFDLPRHADHGYDPEAESPAPLAGLGATQAGDALIGVCDQITEFHTVGRDLDRECRDVVCKEFAAHAARHASVFKRNRAVGHEAKATCLKQCNANAAGRLMNLKMAFKAALKLLSDGWDQSDGASADELMAYLTDEFFITAYPPELRHLQTNLDILSQIFSDNHVMGEEPYYTVVLYSAITYVMDQQANAKGGALVQVDPDARVVRRA